MPSGAFGLWLTLYLVSAYWLARRALVRPVVGSDRPPTDSVTDVAGEARGRNSGEGLPDEGVGVRKYIARQCTACPQ